MAGYPEAHPDAIVSDPEEMDKIYWKDLHYLKEKVLVYPATLTCFWGRLCPSPPLPCPAKPASACMARPARSFCEALAVSACARSHAAAETLRGAALVLPQGL